MRKKILLYICLLALLFMAGCGEEPKTVMGQRYYTGETQTQEQSQTQEQTQAQEAVEEETQQTEAEEITIGNDLFMVISVNMQEESLILEQVSTGTQYMYYYSLATRFFDKYGDYTTISAMEPGRVVTLGKRDEQGRLTELYLSDEVWEYADIVRFSVDMDRGIFYIGDTKYSYDSNIYVNADGNALGLSDLSDMDEIRAVGIGKQILSVSVTSGHGKLELKNTELFNGSYMQIGKEIFCEVKDDLEMELPEGTYTVTVANNGYGGSKDITIEQGETLTLDLDELKGEGPKFGSILFAVDVQDAKMLIDGKEVNYSEPISLQYGLHSLIVTADSYDTYSKKLYVNSKEATIVVQMQDAETVSTASGSSSGSSTGSSSSTGSTSDSTSSAGAEGAAGSLAGSLAGSSTAGSTRSSSSTGSSSSGTALDAASIDTVVNELLDNDSSSTSSSSSSDYISTLSELLKVISGSSGSSN